MRTQCPTCDQWFDGPSCACGYMLPRTLASMDRVPQATPDRGPPLTDDERQAFMRELRTILATLGTRPPTPEPIIPPDPSALADHRRIVHGATIPTAAIVIEQPCGCLHEERLGRFRLLAMCQACRDLEDAMLTVSQKHLTRPLKR